MCLHNDAFLKCLELKATGTRASTLLRGQTAAGGGGGHACGQYVTGIALVSGKPGLEEAVSGAAVLVVQPWLTGLPSNAADL